MTRTICALLAALIVGVPTGYISAMLLTPLLGRLEPVLDTELAGHSGPRDEIFYLIWTVLIPALFMVFRLGLRRAGTGRKPVT